MKNLLLQITQNPWPLAKKIVYTSLIIIGLFMPELLWHKLTIILHFAYESVAFLLEELLIHGLGIRKYYAQMMVFYLFWAMGFICLFGLWQRLPTLLQNTKVFFQSKGLQIKNQAIQNWVDLSVAQKIKFLLFQFAFTAGSFILLLS